MPTRADMVRVEDARLDAARTTAHSQTRRCGDRQSRCLAFDPQDPPRTGHCIPGAQSTLEVVRGMAGKMRDERLAMARDPETRRRLMVAERLLSRSLIPAKADEVRAAVAGLLCHYPDRGVPPDLMPAVMRDWIDDLGRFPPDILRAACQAWRRGDNAYAPAPGQIIALAEPIARMREFYLRLAREALAAGDVVTDGQ